MRATVPSITAPTSISAMRAIPSSMRAVRRDRSRRGRPARLGASVREAVRAVNGAVPSNPQVTRANPLLAGSPLRYRRAMLVRRFDDPVAFRDAATPYLVRDEARHNLMLGISSTLVQKPELYELFDLWLVSDEGDVVGAALRTPPYPLVL